MGCRMIMRPDVVPHKFACQPDRKRSMPETQPRPAAEKRNRLRLVSEALAWASSEISPMNLEHADTIEFASIASEETKIDPVSVVKQEQTHYQQNRHIGIQAGMKTHFRSKNVQCNIKPQVSTLACSPIKFSPGGSSSTKTTTTHPQLTVLRSAVKRNASAPLTSSSSSSLNTVESNSDVSWHCETV